MPPSAPSRVSCTVTLNGLDALAARRWRGPVDWPSFGLSEATLRDRTASITLEEYITYHQALARAHDAAPIPLPREHRRVGRELMTHGSNTRFRHIASLTGTMPALYKAVFGWVFMSQMSMIRSEITVNRPGHITLQFHVDDSYPDCECLFHSFAGSSEMLPLMLKAPPAEVTLEAGSHEATLQVHYTSRPPLRERLSRRLEQLLAFQRGSSDIREVYGELVGNITLLERSNRALQQSQARWSALNRHLPGAVWLLDAEGQVVEASGAMADALLPIGQGSERRALVELFDANSQLTVRDALQRLQNGAASVDFEATTATGDRVLSCSGGPAPLDGATSLVVAQDVTARRDAEESAEKSRKRLQTAQRMEAIGRLASGLAHDTNNLLMTIRGEAQLLRLDRPDDVEVQETMGRVMAAVDRADSLTRNALSPRDSTPEEADTAELSAVLTAFAATQLGADYPVVVEGLPTGEVWVAVPDTLLQRVLLNVVLNARQAMARSGVGTQITIRARLAPSQSIQLSVHDDGPGMDAATLDRALEPFFTTRAEGSGLGLSNSWWSLRRHGASLELSSSPGDGTTAVLMLPLASEQAPAEPTAEATQARTVLLVDDEPELRRVVQAVLAAMGLDVVEASSGAEALEQLERLKEPPALLVSDLTLPRSSGSRLADDVRGRFPQVPVLFLSGVAESEGQRRAQAAEAGFLRKPFRLEALRTTVSHLIGS